MRPRTLGKIVIAVLMVMCLLTSLIYAITHGATAQDNARAVTFAIMALTFATLYRYVED
jgi:hypothetical protein